MSFSDSESTYDAKVLQHAVDNQSEPAYRTRIINYLDKQLAEKQKGLILRQPQPNPVCHCFMVLLEWTDVESSRFLTDGILPRDLASIDQDAAAVLIWIFDATGTGGKLPELELDPLPDFDAHPAFCCFDTDGQDRVALIPSKHLKMMPQGTKVQFVLKEDVEEGIEQFGRNLGSGIL